MPHLSLSGMFTVLKNLSNLLTIGGDWYFFGLTYGWQVRNGIRGDEAGKDRLADM